MEKDRESGTSPAAYPISQISERKSRFARRSTGVGEAYLCLVGATQMRSLDWSDRMKSTFEYMRSLCCLYL